MHLLQSLEMYFWLGCLGISLFHPFAGLPLADLMIHPWLVCHLTDLPPGSFTCHLACHIAQSKVRHNPPQDRIPTRVTGNNRSVVFGI